MTTMSSFESYVKAAVKPGPDRKIPGVVFLAVNKDGLIYEGSFGTESVDPDSPLVDKAISPSTTMWIASCTKLLTAISVLQCVDKGLLDLDADISTICSEFKKIQIITGFDGDIPTYVPANRPVTLRQLLTHSSGLGYAFTHPLLGRLSREPSMNPFADAPTLVFEPGTAWNYGIGSDWAGEAVARVSKVPLREYMRQNIWEPLGMKSTTFRVDERPDIVSNRADMTMRIDDGELIPSPTRLVSDDVDYDAGGGGLTSCPADYIRVLNAILRNDGTLLKQSSMDLLFQPSISDASNASLQKVLFDSYPGNEDREAWRSFGCTLPPSAAPSYALGGLVTEKDCVELITGGGTARRKKGSLSWGGLPNLVWTVDRASGIAYIGAAQLIPPADPFFTELWEKFEQALYAGQIGGSRL